MNRRRTPPQPKQVSRCTVDEILDSLEATGRDWFEGDGCVPVLFFIYSARGLVVVGNADLTPNEYAASVRHIAEQHDAYAVASLMEVRIIHSTTGNRDDFPRDFKDSPDAVEAVTVIVEHRDGTKVSRALIEREIPKDESSPGTLKPFERDTPVRMGMARLTRMLPGARDN